MHYILLTITMLVMFYILSSQDTQPMGVVRIKKRYHKNDMIKENSLQRQRQDTRHLSLLAQQWLFGG